MGYKPNLRVNIVMFFGGQNLTEGKIIHKFANNGYQAWLACILTMTE